MRPASVSLEEQSTSIVRPERALSETSMDDIVGEKNDVAHLSNVSSGTTLSTDSASSHEVVDFNMEQVVRTNLEKRGPSSVGSALSRASSARSFTRHRLSTKDTVDTYALNAQLRTRAAEKVVVAANTNKYDIKNFRKLRSPEDFAKGVRLKPRRQKVMEGMMYHSSSVIPRSLLTLDNDLSIVATRMNKAILGYCGEKSMSFPTTLAQDVLIKALDTPELVDELYIQICKHLTFNPSQDSTGRAWHLLCMAVGTFPPSSELEFYLLNFLSQYLDAAGFIGLYANYAERRLEGMMNSGASGFVPSIDEIQGYKFRPPVLTSIRLVDGSFFTQDLPITPDLDINDVLDMCAHFLELPLDVARRFGLYLEVQPFDKDGETVVSAVSTLDALAVYNGSRPSASSSINSTASAIGGSSNNGEDPVSDPRLANCKQKAGSKRHKHPASLRLLRGNEFIGDIIMKTARTKQKAEARRARHERRKLWRRKNKNQGKPKRNKSIFWGFKAGKAAAASMVTSFGSTVESSGLPSVEDIDGGKDVPWFTAAGKPQPKIEKPVLVMRCKLFFAEDWPSSDPFVNRLLFLQAEDDVNSGRIQFSANTNSTQLMALNVISLLVNRIVLYNHDTMSLAGGETDDELASLDGRSVVSATDSPSYVPGRTLPEELNKFQASLDRNMNLVKRLLKPKSILCHAPWSLLGRTGVKSHADLAKRVIKSAENLIRAKLKSMKHLQYSDVFGNGGDPVYYLRNVLQSMYIEKVVSLTEVLFGCSDLFTVERCEWQGVGVPELSKNIPNHVLIGINAQGLHLIDPLNRSSDGRFLTINFDMMHSWGGSNGVLYLKVKTEQPSDDYFDDFYSDVSQSETAVESKSKSTARKVTSALRNITEKSSKAQQSGKVVVRTRSVSKVSRVSMSMAAGPPSRDYTLTCYTDHALNISSLIYEYAAALKKRSESNSVIPR